jgi:glycosyltransferase involved in cell wall biosynthesis
MARVVRDCPEAHLLLAGQTNDHPYKDRVKREIASLGLGGNISILGERHDVPAILRGCDIGVLSSVSEGLPISLLEYGAAGLPAVATEVGQCPDVLDQGRAGIVVPPSSVERLGTALVALLQSPEQRRALGDRFRERVQKTYSAETVTDQICEIYEAVLGNRKGRGAQPRVQPDIVTQTSSLTSL